LNVPPTENADRPETEEERRKKNQAWILRAMEDDARTSK
jgi:hypothetical protein